MLRTTLPNGLRVLVQENHASAVVAAQVWVEVGSADETADEAGLAHVHEHMLFKGTARRPVGAIAADVEAAGGDINAWTSLDQTVYHVTIASRELPVALDILADAVQHSAFDPDELSRELEVVLEEVRRGRDQPSRVASHMLMASV
ncbi:MAG: pitrilysin family protein, partial [Myxococcota bacterium]